MARRRWNCHGAGKWQRGLAAVEMALVAPFLIMLMLATAELGRLLYQYTTLAKTTRDGARYISANAYFGSTGIILLTPGVKQRGQNLVACGFINCSGHNPLLPGLSPADVSVVQEDVDHISVRASYTYRPMIADALLMADGTTAINISFPLQTSVFMRAL